MASLPKEDQRVRHRKTRRTGYVERITPQKMVTVRWDDALRATTVEAYNLVEEAGMTPEEQAVVWAVRDSEDPGGVALGVAHDIEVGAVRLVRKTVDGERDE